MTSFASFKHPPNHLARIRVSYCGVSAPPPSNSKSPLPSPRCHAAAPAAKLATASHTAPSDSNSSGALHGPAYSTSSAAHTDSRGILRLGTYDDFYDSAVPMSGAPGWERVQDDLGLDEALPGADPQEWEEMVSLLSFDGEEHKRVMRQVHGANTRVEDMFASFDGDDFEAVLRAARGEIPGELQEQDDPSQPAATADKPGSNSNSGGLYQSVCALRAAAMAAEAAKRQCPGPRRRRAPLEDKSSADAWMLQVPYAVADNGQNTGAASTVTAAAVAAAASAEGCETSTRAQVDSAARTEVQTAHSAAESQAPPAAALLQSLTPYVGLSCDSSSDGGCHSESGVSAAHYTELLRDSNTATGLTAADSTAKEPNRQAKAQQPPAAAAVSASNNIVSSRALASRLSAPATAMAVAGGRNVARDVILEAPAAAAPARLPTRAAMLQQSGHRQVLWPAGDFITQPAAAGVSTAANGAGAGAAASVPTGVQGAAGARWSSRSTGALRRALTRLHKHLPAQ